MKKARESLKFWVWRFRLFILLLKKEWKELWGVWKKHSTVLQLVSFAFYVPEWKDYYEDDYTPREALREDMTYW
jgi:hypothetical protein